MPDDPPALRRLNINLLYALHALLETPTVTAAARRLALTQPAMSMALRRLRDHFGDELVLHGPPRRLTALGEALHARAGRLLREIDDTLNLTLEFDPATVRRTVTLTAPEAIELMYLSRVVPRMLRAAPGIDVRLMPFRYGAVDRLFEGGADVAIVPHAMTDPALCARPLFDHGLTGMVAHDFPLDGSRLSREAYAEGRHAALFDEMERPMFGDRGDDPLITRRRIVVRTGRYAMLPHLVIGTDLIVTTSNWLAQHYASILPVRAVDLPIAHDSSPLLAQWQAHRRDEPLVRWIVDMLAGAVDWEHKYKSI